MCYRLKKLFLFCFLAQILVAQSITGEQNLDNANKELVKPKKGVKMSNYMMRFSDYLHRSFVNIPLSLKGKIDCIHKTEPNEFWPFHMISLNNTIYVQYTNFVKHFTENGTLLDSRDSDPGFDITLLPKVILCKSSSSIYGYSYDWNELFKHRIYNGFSPSSIKLAYPINDQMILAQTHLRRQKNPGEKGSSSRTNITLMKGERLGWTEESSGRMPVAILTEDFKSVVLVKESYTCQTHDILTGAIQHSFRLNDREILAMSLDHKGNIVASCVSGKEVASLVSCSLDGTVKWDYEFNTRRWGNNPQPPVIDAQGQVYVIVGNMLYLIIDGKATELTTILPSDMQCITAFNNSTVAIVSGPSIKIVDSKGKEVFSGYLPDDEITTPAIPCGSSGALYFGAKSGIYRVE